MAITSTFRLCAVLSACAAVAGPHGHPLAQEVATQHSASLVRGEVLGAPELVLKGSSNGCDPRFLPDTAATAFRDFKGNVHLFSTWQHNYALTGPSLNLVKLNCSLLYQGQKNPDPAAFDDNAWLTSFYTEDGRTIHALVHDEYHGLEHPGKCEEAKSQKCWYNAVTRTVSHDGGAHFEHPDASKELVGSIPFRYGELSMPAGMFEPTNIVRVNSHYFVMATIMTPGKHRGGVCLMRTDRLDDASSWRGWDGHDFTVRFVNPYSAEADADADDRLCEPIAPAQLQWHVTSLVHYARKGVFVAVMQATVLFPPNAVSEDGVYLATSTDLIHWSDPSLLMPASSKFHFDCNGGRPISHPALLDPQASDRNFTEVGDDPFLYYTLINTSNCKVSTNVDLYRVKVDLGSKR